jgi:hypothetical protein
MPEDDIPSDVWNQAAFQLIADIRGGLPERCDFCGLAYTEGRYAIPEEAGEWACNHCYARWYPEHAAQYLRKARP